MSYRHLIPITILAAAIGAIFYSAITPAPLAQATGNDWLLAWSSDSYIPPDYQGRALPSRGSTIKVALVPINKSAPNSEQLIYRWLLDDEVAYSAGGRGKSSFAFKATKWGGDSHRIEAQILDGQENIVWRSSLSIRIANPQVTLKTSGGQYAIVDSADSGTGRNLALSARPFFFQAQKISDLLFKWTLDGQTLTAPDEKDPDRLTIKIPAGKLSETVYKNLSLFVENKADELQRLTVNITIEIK